MTQARFYARPVHDRESGRWTVDTNIDGLFVEAASEEECQKVITEFAADLIRENHGVERVTVIQGRKRRAGEQAWSLAAPA